jgi:hypothetical protein
VSLLDNVLHAGGPNDEGTNATATIHYTITDADGSAVTGNPLTITFNDDAPTLAETGGPEKLILPNVAGSASGSFAAEFGADGAKGYHITTPDIDGITYTQTQITDSSGNFLRTELLAETADGTDVFKLTVNVDGSYTFDLITPGAATQESISLSTLGAGGPGFRELADDPSTPTNEAGRIEFQSNGSGVNASKPGFGVSNQWTDPGEWFELEFHDPGNFDTNDAPETDADLLDSVTLNIQQVKDGPVDFTWTAIRYNADGTVAATETGTFAVSSAGDLTIDPSIQFSVLRLENNDTTGSVRFSTDITVARTVLPPDVSYDFTVVGIDGDLDTSDPIHISVFVDEPSAPPLALDLDGDGVEFVSRAASVAFDYLGEGNHQNTAWVGADDGLLAIDLNANGTIDGASEIVFGGNGLTDLEGLAAKYDTNQDGVLDAQDAQFSSFGVWQDANSNGVSDDGEFRTLAEAGIVSIDLKSNGQAYTTAEGDVLVHGETSYILEDGTVGTVADSAFTYSQPATVYGGALRAPERSGSLTQVTADAVVAASLVTMIETAAQAEPGKVTSPLFDELGQNVPATSDLPSQESQDHISRDAFDSTPERSDAKPEGAPNNHALRADDEQDSTHQGLNDNMSDGDGRSDAAATGNEPSSDSLFDAAPAPIAPPTTAMDGLMALRAATPEIAANQDAGDVASDVLAEALNDGGLDKLIDALVDGPADHTPGSGEQVDFWHMLDMAVTSEMAIFVHQPIEHDLHQLASA